MKKLLNVGGLNKEMPLPPQYADFEHILLDIDPTGSPDLLCDARQLSELEPDQFDAILCSHNLEHYFHHEVPQVLAGFLHVLKPHGFVQILVPNMQEVMRAAVSRNLDVEDVLYVSAVGPITVRDVIYGFAPEIERSGKDYFAHKTCFSAQSLANLLTAVGFNAMFSQDLGLELDVLAFKDTPDPEALALFKLKAGSVV